MRLFNQWARPLMRKARMRLLYSLAPTAAYAVQSAAKRRCANSKSKKTTAGRQVPQSLCRTAQRKMERGQDLILILHESAPKVNWKAGKSFQLCKGRKRAAAVCKLSKTAAALILYGHAAQVRQLPNIFYLIMPATSSAKLSSRFCRPSPFSKRTKETILISPPSSLAMFCTNLVTLRSPSLI